MKGIFDELKEANNNLEIDDSLKDKFLEQIDTPKNQEGYYLDAFGERISFNGIRQLKKPYTKLNLNKHQQQEIKACHQDYFYFRTNYCKILTKSGIGRPEPRDYQVRLEKELVKGDDVLAFFPRQCVTSDTLITVNNKEIPIKDLFLEPGLETEQNETFIKTRNISGSNLKIKTNTSVSKIVEVHLTEPLDKYKITLENGMELFGSPLHTLINENKEEISLINSLGEYIITEYQPQKVIQIDDLKVKEQMYDVSIESEEQLYFTNGILSHNSGKTVTISTFLLWSALTRKNIIIGIAANVLSLAQEVLDKIKKIYVEMPIWLQPGLVSWNKQSVEFDNGTKILISASNSDSFRGFSLDILYLDEAAFLRSTIWNEFLDAVMPAMAAKQDSQAIFSSTANGLNSWYHMVEGARKPKKEVLEPEDIIVLEDGTETTVKDYYENTTK